MNWNKFITYGDSQQNSFETLCNQLFERYLKRTYEKRLNKFRVINGAGGDGGIEAYGELISGDIIAVQAKWFTQSLGYSEIRQIKNSILTAIKLRSQIKEYIICIPHNVNSLKIGRGKKHTTNHEENKVNALIDEINKIYPDLNLTWWFDNEILTELQQGNNEGVYKYWFDNEIISLEYLQKQFKLQKKGWLNERYIPELHGQGLIHKEYHKVCFSLEWRQELYRHTEDALNDIQFCVTQIEQFIPINHQLAELNPELEAISENLKSFHKELKALGNQIKTGNDSYKSQKISEYSLWDIKLKLETITPDNSQKNILPKLIASLDNVHKYDLPQFIEQINLGFIQSIRLILGEPGTGKTHGLANCVENHLNQNSPGLIIQAKGYPNNDWTEILSKSLELRNWRKDEILSALESLAIRNDVHIASLLKAGEEPNSQSTKVIVCIDGLEEDIENEKQWYSRIRESEQLTIDYPRVKFIFSARRYFYNNQEVPTRGLFEEIFLPREGDVPISEISEKYFSKDHYNIQISSYSLINGIDSLFALRLFCEQYKNSTITKRDRIVTATRDLLNLKIEKINQEFLLSLQNKKGNTRNPILESLEIIADFFYSNVEVEHNYLVELIEPVVGNYMDNSEIDSLIDYLAINGFLIQSVRIEDSGILKKKKYFYNITYQSIIEHIISSKTSYEIKNGLLNKIPSILKKGMIQPLDFNPRDALNINDKMPNKRIIQNIVVDLFIEKGQLIGENNFLTEGFNKKEVFELQMEALRSAPKELALKYKSKVDSMFFGGFQKQFQILKLLILPSSYTSESVYGAEYLHSILINQPSVFERDKLWSGLDNYEKRSFDSEDILRYTYENNTLVFDELGIGKLYLSEFHKYNELPLVFVWGLSTIDQKLRNSLRVALTEWAIKQPSEFLLLLDKIFLCNDPQIQEDLASIMLGVASRLKEKNEIKNLASWSIENIFNHTDIYRNIIVRQGFRAIVERAYQLDLLTKKELLKSRPKPAETIYLLPLESKVNTTGRGDECYPIVHDLAWYVIKKAYDDFLAYPSLGNGLEDNDCKEAKTLLGEYRKKPDGKGLYAHSWTMSIAIAYIRSLGFTRTQGNGYTEASHGGKSKIFTYEEKYTWLAVHYIQGYLSDYIPIKRWSGERVFVKDYFQITDIPNPAESIINIDEAIDKVHNKSDWVIKEVLSKELDTKTNIKDSITNWINEEPELDFKKWLCFDSVDFNLNDENRNWLALYNHTSLHDSNEICYSYIDIKACLVYKSDFKTLQQILKENSDDLHFTTHLDGLSSSPQTDTYCNPTDIVWMTWIDEDEKNQIFYDSNSDTEKELFHALTKIVQNTIDGENYIMLPSKKVRELIGSYELLGSELKNQNQETVAFNFKKSNGSYRDNQELVLIDQNLLQDSIEKKGLEIVWFIELFKQKNPLNKSLDKDFHIQKARKYFCWLKNGGFENIKFWDESFTNQRDKDEFE